MFGLGMGEIVVILIVALLVLGPEKLPDAAKQIGKTIRELRRHTRDLQETIEKDEHIGGTVREIKSALRGDDLPSFRSNDILPASGRFKPPEIEKPVAQIAAGDKPADADKPAGDKPADADKPAGDKPAETPASLAAPKPASDGEKRDG